MINIVLFGPPGSGKGTQAQNLIQKFNLKQISTGDLCRYNMKNNTELGVLAKSYIDKGELVPDQVTTDMLTDEVKKSTDSNGFIFDGYPRTANQTEALEKIVKEVLNDRISICLSPVSYTHLDVYKRQAHGAARRHHRRHPDDAVHGRGDLTRAGSRRP